MFFFQRNFLATENWRFAPQSDIPIKHHGKEYTPFITSLNNTSNESITQHWRASCNHCYIGKAISITCSDCMFVTLGSHHAMSMSHTVICGMLSCTVFFHIISQTQQFLKKKKLLKMKRVFWFSLHNFSETLLILRRTEQEDMVKNVHWNPRPVPGIHVRF